jgi:hypothetical protein
MLNNFTTNILFLLAYLRDIFEKFSTFNPRMQRNDTNIIAVTDKSKEFIGKGK